MAKKTQDKKKNSFYVRIYDDDVLTSIYELSKTKQFSSMNDLLCQALSIGIEKIYLSYGKKKALRSDASEPIMPATEKIDEMLSRLKNMELTVNDLFVMLSVIEMMNTTLYNVEAAKSNGEAISSELMDNGYFSTLPMRYQTVKDKLINRIEKKKNKE